MLQLALYTITLSHRHPPPIRSGAGDSKHVLCWNYIFFLFLFGISMHFKTYLKISRWKQPVIFRCFSSMVYQPKHLTVCLSVTVFSSLHCWLQHSQIYWNGFLKVYISFICRWILLLSCMLYATLLWNYQSRRRLSIEKEVWFL